DALHALVCAYTPTTRQWAPRQREPDLTAFGPLCRQSAADPFVRGLIAKADLPASPRFVNILPLRGAILAALLLLPVAASAQGWQTDPLEAGTVALGDPERAEWTEGEGIAQARALDLRFEMPSPNPQEWTLSLRQEGVRRDWQVTLNGDEVGRLNVDENPMRVSFRVAAGTLRSGENLLRVVPLDSIPDDVAVGSIMLARAPRRAFLEAATLVIAVRGEGETPMPARITIVDGTGALQETGAESGGLLKVRPGVVYSGDGRARIPLPAGS